jgi:hypothetical protein
MKKIFLKLAFILSSNYLFSQNISLSNFGISKLSINKSSILIEAKSVNFNNENIDLNKSRILRKSTNGVVEYTFSNYKNVKVSFSNNEMKIINRKKLFTINEKNSSSLDKFSSIYLLLAIKIESELKIGINENLGIKIIPIKPDKPIQEMIVVGCFGFGGTATAASARSSSCIASQEFKACMYLGTDVSCLWDNMVCISVATFDCP